MEFPANIEQWVTINNYPNYVVSSFGRVMNVRRGKIIRGSVSVDGYVQVGLRKNNRTKPHYVHRLVAGEFIANPYNKPLVDHIDNNPNNNHYTNLRWATSKDNQGNSRKQAGTSSSFKGVSWDNKSRKWRAYIKFDQTVKHLGYFNIEEDAARAYDEYARAHFGEFAKTNFVYDSGPDDNDEQDEDSDNEVN